VGLDFPETSRQVAFCAHTILHADKMIVADATLDPRFSQNPLVTGKAGLRFYAGFPLFSREGQAIGTLTVMDIRSRELSDFQVFSLRLLARQVGRWLELRRSVAQQARELDRATASRVEAEQLYRTLWETTTDTVIIIDTSSTIRFASPSATELFQQSPEELIGRPLAILQPVRFREGHGAGLRRFLETGEKRVDWRSTEVQALRRDGSEVPVEIAFSQIEQGGEPMFVGFFRDISVRKAAERELFQQKEQAQATLRSIADGVVVVDESGNVQYLNPLAEAMTRWSNAEALGRGHGDVLDLVDANGARPFSFGALPDDADAPLALPGEQLQLRRRGGIPILVEGNVTRLNDLHGRRAGSVIAFRDITSRRHLEAQLSHQSAHDPLTGLLNRAEFEERLAVAADTGEDATSHALLYLDLDQFKLINDTAGHPAGDELLRQVGMVLRGHLRSTDTLARLGGDEFGLLLQFCPFDRAQKIAETLRTAVADHGFAWADNVFGITASIGHVHFGAGALAAAEAMGKADEACYLAKDLGRNRVQSYHPGDEELARRHGEMEWVSQARKALRDEDFVLFAQDIVALGDAAGGRHREILLRMRNADGGLISPMAFIPAAERYNLMPAIDRWVIGAVVRALRSRIQADPAAAGECYSINLSGASVTDANLGEFIAALLDETGVPARCLCFEITETAAIGNLAHALMLIEPLRKRGCRFSLDDFGSGMSSFSYLKQLPVDYLKIDGIFIRDIANDPIDRAMVAAIHQIGKLMGLSTVAEFVENDDILRELRLIGIDYGQGYGLSMPVPFL
jgi:diguanylate cyclase (GGDEF)-like protein/PAS domain S-box-containing protein